VTAEAFCEGLINPETGEPFVLTDAERVFLAHAFEMTADGRLLYPELVFSAPKKSGKTGFGAMLLLYVVCKLGGRFAEGYVGANDFEQSMGRVFQAAQRIVQATPELARDAKVTQDTIAFKSSGATIKALANDYAGAAGSNPTITVFDELWAFTSEKGHRFFDEQVPPPTRRIACRLTVTYAGFEGESTLLEQLYRRGMRGEQLALDLYAQPGMLMFWTNAFTAPWQTEAWREQMRQQLRPSAFLRLVENRWVSSESSFVDMAWWDECVIGAIRPVLTAPRLPVWVGVDASVKRDSTAIAACTWDHEAQRVRLVRHWIWQPSEAEPLDFESTVERTLLQLSRDFSVREVRYDPFQMQAVAQRLLAARVPMLEFAQTSGNLTEASTGLYELVKARNIAVYADDTVRLAVQRSVAIETPRGWRIAKEKTSHRIDVVVALAMAALGAVQASTGPAPLGHAVDLLVDERPVAMPKWCTSIVTALVADVTGRAGVMFFAHHMDPNLPAEARATLVDFWDTNLADIHQRVVDRTVKLSRVCGAAQGGYVYVMPELLSGFEARGFVVTPIAAEWLRRGDDLAICVRSHIASGRVKVAEPAFDESRNLPLGGALVFQGEAGNDPLRLAWLAGLRLCVGD